jgi:hypothetical protein
MGARTSQPADSGRDSSAEQAASRLFGGGAATPSSAIETTHLSTGKSFTAAVAQSAVAETPRGGETGIVVPSPAVHVWENRTFTWEGVDLNGLGNAVTVEPDAPVTVKLNFATRYSGGGYTASHMGAWHRSEPFIRRRLVEILYEYINH